MLDLAPENLLETDLIRLMRSGSNDDLKQQ